MSARTKLDFVSDVSCPWCAIGLQALISAYFTDGADPSDHATLIGSATQAGLDPAEAQAVLASDRYGAEVRAHEQFYGSQGINGVPALIIDDRHLIEEGQPVAVF